MIDIASGEVTEGKPARTHYPAAAVSVPGDLAHRQKSLNRSGASSV
jgi:hypothetical protein